MIMFALSILMTNLPAPGTTGAEGKAAADGLLTAGGMTCAAVTEDFLATRGSLQTRRAYGAAVRGFFRSAGIALLAELRPEVRPPAEVSRLVREYLDSVTKRGEAEPRRILNPAAVNARAEALRAFFGWLMAAYGYPVNPVAGAFVSLPTARTSSSDSLTRGELRDLLQLLSGEARRGERELRDYLLVALLFGLALRRTEVAGLKWADIDFGQETVAVERGGGRETLPLPRKLAGYLAEYAKRGGGGRYVFRAPRTGKGSGGAAAKGEERPLTAQSVFRIVLKAAERVVPAKHITPQGLRKTFIELALAEGEPLEAICNATGHARPESLDYYAGGRKLKENAIHTVAGKYL
jgi:integrase